MEMGMGMEMEMGVAGTAGDARGPVVMGFTDDAAAGIDLIKAANSAAGRHMDGAMKGLAAEDGRIRVGKLTREIVEKTIDEVIVWPGMKVDVKWKFKK